MPNKFNDEILKSFEKFTKQDSSWIGASGYMLDIDLLKSFLLTSLQRVREDEHAKAYKAGQEQERQFILNILDGIDIADKELGGGGTKAIRLALQSRII